MALCVEKITRHRDQRVRNSESENQQFPPNHSEDLKKRNRRVSDQLCPDPTDVVDIK